MFANCNGVCANIKWISTLLLKDVIPPQSCFLLVKFTLLILNWTYAHTKFYSFYPCRLSYREMQACSWFKSPAYIPFIEPRYTLHSVISTSIMSHSLISWNSRERMFIVHISLLIVIFLSLESQILSFMQTTKEVNPHPRIASCVNMWSVFFFFFFCHLLNVGACVHHIVQEGQMEWTTPHHSNVALCVIP